METHFMSVIIVGNEIGDQSSNPGQICFAVHFMLMLLGGKACIQLCSSQLSENNWVLFCLGMSTSLLGQLWIQTAEFCLKIDLLSHSAYGRVVG